MQHVAVVAASAVEVLLEKCHVDGVDGYNQVLRVGCGGGEHGSAVFGGLDQLLALPGVDAKAHAVDEHEVVVGGAVELLDGQVVDFDETVVVGPGNLSEGDGLVVDEGNARGRGHPRPCEPKASREQQSRQREENYGFLSDFVVAHLFIRDLEISF